ncbi:MAG: glycosyltransferase family 4 protein [Promethearchaeota archaeon]
MSLSRVESKKVVTILSDSPTIPTGYRNQSLQLALYLHNKGYEIHFLGNAYNGITIKNMTLEDGIVIPFKLYGEMQQTYFRNKISNHLKKTKSNIFIILLDTFMLHGGDAWFLNVDTSPAKTFFWYPSDGGGGLPIGCDNILRKIDMPVAMSKFGQKQVKDYYNINTHYIPHGVDTENFKPLSEEEKQELRKKYNLVGKYVVGVVARNQPRKHLDRTIKMFRLVANKIPEAILLLHMDPNDPANRLFNLKSLIKKYNLENRVLFTGMKGFNGIAQNKMGEIYNLMDVFLLTTSGEGFGIPIIEAMSCKIPVVMTNYTTCEELVLNHKAGLPINLSGCQEESFFDKNSNRYDLNVINGTLTGSWEVERGICDIQHGALQIQFLYKNPKMGRLMGKNGREAVLNNYDFKIVGRQWEDIINE